jgi:hypothetical protein
VAPGLENTIWTSSQMRSGVGTYPDKCDQDLDLLGCGPSPKYGRPRNARPSLLPGPTRYLGYGPVPTRGQTHLAKATG